MIALKTPPATLPGNPNDTKVYSLFSRKKTYAFFKTAIQGRHIKLYLPDLMLANTGAINKKRIEVFLRNGERHYLADCSFHQLLNMSPKLVQVNKDQLVSVDAINEIRHDLITLKNMPGNKPAYLALGRDYRNSLKEKLSYR